MSQPETASEALMALWVIADEAGIEYRDIIHMPPVQQAEIIGSRLRSSLTAKRIEIARTESRMFDTAAVAA
jgi:hypothetical protein